MMNLRLLVTVSLLMASLPGCAGAVAPAGDAAFDVHRIDTGVAANQTVLAGSFTGARHAQVAVLSRDGAGGHRLRIHRLDGDVVREATLEGKLGFVDLTRIAGRDHLVMYRNGGVSVFDADAAAELAFVPMATEVRPGEGGNLPRVDVTRDLNGDGRDDIVIPDTDGFWIALQRDDGAFADALKLGPAEPHLEATAYGDTRTYGEVGITAQNIPWYLGRVHVFDYDRDGRSDLVFWNGEGFDVHRQDGSGGFEATPKSFATDVPFDFDGAYGLIFQFGDRGVPSLLLGLGGRFDYTVLNGFQDLNGDGVADLVTMSFAGRRVFSLRGRLQVHFGRPARNATAFSAVPDAVVETPGPAGGLAWGYASQSFVDVDGNGQMDIALGSVDTGLGGMLRAMVGKSITIDLALYRLHDGTYSREPDAVRRVRTAFAPFDKRGVLFPTTQVGDVNGDGRLDLLTADRWERLSVVHGAAGTGDPFDGAPTHVAVDVPANEANVRLVDLNRDGAEDIVLFHPSEAQANRVVVLIARAGR